MKLWWCMTVVWRLGGGQREHAKNYPDKLSKITPKSTRQTHEQFVKTNQTNTCKPHQSQSVRHTNNTSKLSRQTHEHHAKTNQTNVRTTRQNQQTNTQKTRQLLTKQTDVQNFKNQEIKQCVKTNKQIREQRVKTNKTNKRTRFQKSRN